MEDEEIQEEAPVTEAPKLDPKKRETHPAVMAIKGHECDVEGCGFIFGDPNAGLEPHPIQHIVVKPHNNLSMWTPPPVKLEKAASDPNVCQNAVTPPNDCDECGWKHDSDKPHPIQL